VDERSGLVEMEDLTLCFSFETQCINLVYIGLGPLMFPPIFSGNSDLCALYTPLPLDNALPSHAAPFTAPSDSERPVRSTGSRPGHSCTATNHTLPRRLRP